MANLALYSGPVSSTSALIHAGFITDFLGQIFQNQNTQFVNVNRKQAELQIQNLTQLVGQQQQAQNSPGANQNTAPTTNPLTQRPAG